MNAEDRIYRELQIHLDRMPVGYPSTESGVEIRMLKHLFTPEEARLATQLSMLPESLERIYKRVKKDGISIQELEQTLDHMRTNGCIEVIKKDGKNLYSNAMLVIGMYEYQLERLTEDFAKDWLQYLDEAFADEFARTKILQIRTIPIKKSIPHERHVASYDDIWQIIDGVEEPIAVANCVCRQTKDVVGESCKKTELRETCILFGRIAQAYLDWGISRPVNRDEAVSILKRAQEDGLVLQPQNAQQPEFVCCCCGDCCGLLTSIKKFPNPSELYATNHYAEVDTNACSGCEICVDRCQLEALAMVDGIANVNLNRCIGCGNCVVICKDDAIQLKEKDKPLLPPKDTGALYMKILSKKVGKWNMLKVGAKMLLGRKV